MYRMVHARRTPTLHAQTEKAPYCITPPQQRRKSP